MNCTILTLLWKLTLIFEIASKIKSANLTPENNSSVKVEQFSVGGFTDFTVHSMQENSCDAAVDQGGAGV